MLHGMGVKTGVSLEKLIEAGSFISSHLGRETMSRYYSTNTSFSGVNVHIMPIVSELDVLLKPKQHSGIFSKYAFVFILE